MPHSIPHLLRPLLASLMAVLIFAGCGDGDYRPIASGPNAQISVVIDSSNWNGPVGEAIRLSLGEYQGTLPAPEPLFDLQPVNLRREADLERAKTQKNVVFVAPISDSTNEASVMRSILSDDVLEAVRTGEIPAAVIPRENQWRKSQQVYYITGQSEGDLLDAIASRTEDLRYAFAKKVRERMQIEMFEKGRQQPKEEQIMEKHGFAVNVQHDYLIALDTTSTVWLRRILTDTWRGMLVHYIENFDPSRLDAEFALALRDSLSQLHRTGNVGGFAETDYRRPIESENIDFLGRYGFEVRGLWHMVGYEGDRQIQYGQGGPFVNYTFYDEPTGRLYVLDGMVFAPGHNKREFLRQMETIAYTFRTEGDLQETPPLATD